MNSEVQNIINANGFQFFSCYKCGELISAIELDAALKKDGVGCRCGCMKVQPVQVKVEQYTRRNVVEMAIHLGISEEAFVDDFLVEARESPINLHELPTLVTEIRTHFKEVLRCN